MEDIPTIRKKEEFEAFIEALEGSSVAHWKEIAEAIGVDKDTITEWKKHPKAQEARRNGLRNALNQMELAGKNDWHMWETKLKMLGINKDNINEYNNPSDESRRTMNQTAELLQKIYGQMHEDEERASNQVSQNLD